MKDKMISEIQMQNYHFLWEMMASRHKQLFRNILAYFNDVKHTDIFVKYT